MDVEKIVLNGERNVTLTAYTQPVEGEFNHISKRPAVLILPGGGPGPVPSQRKEERRYPYERDSSHPCRAVRTGLPLQP